MVVVTTHLAEHVRVVCRREQLRQQLEPQWRPASTVVSVVANMPWVAPRQHAAPRRRAHLVDVEVWNLDAHLDQSVQCVCGDLVVLPVRVVVPNEHTFRFDAWDSGGGGDKATLVGLDPSETYPKSSATR